MPYQQTTHAAAATVITLFYYRQSSLKVPLLLALNVQNACNFHHVKFINRISNRQITNLITPLKHKKLFLKLIFVLCALSDNSYLFPFL